MTDSSTQSSDPTPEANVSEAVSVPESKTYYLVLVSEFDVPQVLTFDNPGSVATAIKDYKLSNAKFYAYVFEGHRWRITKGRNSHMVSPEADQRFALFDEEENHYDDNGLVS